MGEQGGPEGPVNGRDLLPVSAAVPGLKDVGHGPAVLRALRPKLVVRGDVISVGENGQAGRADVNAGGGRAVVNDHARHNCLVSREQNIDPGVELIKQADQRQGAQALQESWLGNELHIWINCPEARGRAARLLRPAANEYILRPF